MKLIIGLGNPGNEHANQRHNIGFMAVDALAHAHRFGGSRRKFSSDYFEGECGGEKIIALKPQTFMNKSGKAVAEAIHFHKTALEDVIVIHDELDLALGKLRIKRGGGAGGHNGLRDIDARLGTPEYWRLRMGIGHPGDKDQVIGYVLNDFNAQEMPLVKRWCAHLAQNMETFWHEGPEALMTKLALVMGKEEKRDIQKEDSKHGV